jgi:hypothetical protein
VTSIGGGEYNNAAVTDEPGYKRGRRRVRKALVGLVVACALLVAGLVVAYKIWQRATYRPLFSTDRAGAPATRVEIGDAIPETKRTYVGQWEGPSTSVRITETARFVFFQRTDGGIRSFATKIRAFAGDDLVLAAYQEQFVPVQRPPYREGDTWRMTLEGVTLERVGDP